MTDQALLTARQSARYLGVSKAFFEAKIRPYIGCIDLRAPGKKKPMPRWEVVELDLFIATRKKAQKSKAAA